MMVSIMSEYVGMTEAKTALPSVIKRLEDGAADHVFVMRNNKPAAVLLAVQDYEDLRTLQSLREHLEDALMIHEATRADSGERHSLDDVFTELGVDA
jgi:PHD/YefM family antitoxin component YafN of YafNO toxin-antitoxin module